MEVHSLDLHGTIHMDVRQKVISFIESFWNNQTELRIITGNSLKMKGIVIDVIEEYDLPFQISEMPSGQIITWTL